MVEYLTQHLQTVAIDLFRLCLWLAILSVIFVPLERLFALHRAAVFRDGIGTESCLVRNYPGSGSLTGA
jgi:hypothetical protein